MSIEKERLAYYVLFATLIVSLLGVSYSRYTVYISPLLLFFIWLTSPYPRLHFNRDLVPFVAVILFGLLTIPVNGLQGLKWLLFISVYVTTFTLFDFSKIRIDLMRMGLILFGVFLFTTLVLARRSGIGGFSLLNSESSLESTIAFSFGTISAYFFISKQNIKAFVFAVFTLLALKRIALIALIVVFIATILPARLTQHLTRPWLVTILALATLPMAILFAYSYFDSIIMDVFGVSANKLAMGRQDLWYKLLTNVDYNFWRFLLYGVGSSGSLDAVQSAYKSVVLIHNDILALYLDYGLVFVIFFLYSLCNHHSQQKCLMSGYLLILFLTDNVLVYQHTMMVYLICQSQLERGTSTDSETD